MRPLPSTRAKTGRTSAKPCGACARIFRNPTTGARRTRPERIPPNSSTRSPVPVSLRLVPEEYGGTGLPLRAAAVILEEVCAAGCHAAAGHAQMYTMGHRAQTRQRSAEAASTFADRRRDVAAAGVRRHRADDRIGHDATQNARDQERDRGYTAQGPEDLHVTCAAFGSDARARAHDAARRGERRIPRHFDFPHRHAGLARQRARGEAARSRW